MTPSSLSKIFRAADGAAGPVRITGLSGSARAWFLVQLFKQRPRPLLVIAPDDESAQDMLSDWEALAPLAGAPPHSAVALPDWDHSLYSSVAPSLRVRLQRSAALASLCQAESTPAVVFSSPSALIRKTLSAAEFRAHSVHVQAGESCGGRDALLAALVSAGYLKADSAEDRGTVAARGELVDVFPPDRALPIRIELFDDQVERIRSYDPSTQRTVTTGPGSAALSSVQIFPCRETLINPDNVGQLRERIKKLADDRGTPRSVRDPVLESLRPGAYPANSDGWSSLASSDPGSALEFFSAAGTVVRWDDLGADQAWDSHWDEERRTFTGLGNNLGNNLGPNLGKDAGHAENILPAPEDLYDLKALHQITARAAFVAQKLALTELEDLPSAGAQTGGEGLSHFEDPQALADAGSLSLKHAVSIRTNSDLSESRGLDAFEEKFALWRRQGFRVVVDAPTRGQSERLAHLLTERGLPVMTEGAPEPGLIFCRESGLASGFRWPSEGWVFVTEGELLGTRDKRRRAKGARGQATSSTADDWAGLQALADLSPGDAVVHMDHGLGRYLGLERLALSGAPADFLMIEYAGKDKLYLPVYRLNVIQKHSSFGESVTLDKLGAQQFQKTKEKVKESVKRLAFDLVKLYAERTIRTGFRFSRRDAIFEEFEARFPYEETPDQSKAIDAALDDMAAGKIMDRLVCGDVGYGKTEVAIRAAYRAALDGKQVALLVPTTLLAHQHEQTFRSRLSGTPLVVESLSRFKSTKEQKEILSRAEAGRVDILVGTHRLLSRDVKFKDLGLLIVDEEHRFGVEHKEKIKSLKINVPVLTLTATPIPRTLHMALSGLREISLIRTPPVDRLPIRTFISKQDDALIQRAVTFELSRGGQVFYLYNRVQSIYEAAAHIKKLCPDAKVVVGHGQMAENELEAAVREFYDKRANVLVCTSIIESGIDLPSANTIIIHRADAFGLAQLYQIRGRVGRGQQRGYAYLLIPAEGAVSEDAKKRLEVIQRFVELGSGFNVASHDLEIRGGGDLLGPQQSGNIQAVGFDMYLSLLEEAIQEIRAEEQKAPQRAAEREPEIKAPFSAFLSETFVPDVHQRLSLYRRLSSARGDEEIDLLEEELVDRFGALEPEASSLLWLIRVKVHLKRLGIDALTVGPERVVLVPGPRSALDPVRAIALVSAYPSKYQLLPDSRLVAHLKAASMKDLYFGIQELLKRLSPAQGVANAKA